jgi:hypothetical protein
MRNPLAKPIVALLAVLAFSPALMAQEPAQERAPRAVQPGYVTAGVPEMPNPPGPAPKQSLTGAWVGPIRTVMGPFPDMTPAGNGNGSLPRYDAGGQGGFRSQ